jgi:hypothetical protein
LLNCYDQELTLEDADEIQKPSALEEAEEPEAEPHERTMTVLKLAEGLGLTEGGIEVLEDICWNRQRAAATGQGIVRMLAFCEEILKQKKGSLPLKTSVLDFFKSSSGIAPSPPVLLDTRDDDPDDCLLFKRKCLLLPLPFVCQISCF